MTPARDAFDRARASLLGMTLGEAVGMPSQTLTRAEIARCYGRIAGFVPPHDGHPVSHGLQAGQVTDDTEQSLLLARRLIAGPDHFDDLGWANDSLEWERDIRARGLRDLLGPSSKAALEALLAGVLPEDIGPAGTTNGGAMRIAPVGTSVKSHESVPAAFGLLHLNGGAVWPALPGRANIGDGTDTSGTITGAMCGACAGMGALPEAAIVIMTKANELHEIDDIARALIALRYRKTRAAF